MKRRSILTGLVAGPLVLRFEFVDALFLEFHQFVSEYIAFLRDLFE